MLAIFIALFCYSAIFISFFVPEEKIQKFGLAVSSSKTVFTILFINALIAHLFSFLPNLTIATGFSFSFSNTLLLSSWVISVLYFISSLKISLINIGLVVIPFNLILLATYPFLNHADQAQNLAPLIAIHIISSIVAFSLLIIASIQAITLSMQSNTLHKHHSNALVRKLPAYLQMEKVLCNLIDLGLVFLSLSLISGFIFLDDLFAQHLVHKTVLSIIAWVIFGTLALGRRLQGWQSKTVIRATISASLLLVMGFLGSKLIIEFLAKS